MKFLLLVALAAIAAAVDETQLMNEFRGRNIHFTAEIYNELQKTTSNNFLASPLSLQIVLALLENGAKGNTAEQIAHALRLPPTEELANEMFHHVSSNLHGNEHYDLQSANKIYVKDGFTIANNFKTNAVTNFDAEIQDIDFSKKPEAVAEINKWIEEKTKDKIKDMVGEDNISGNTVAILVNALYFHGEWVNKFPQYATESGTFHLNHKDHVDVDMMHNMEMANYYEDSESKVKFLQLPYLGDDVTMNIVLPHDKEGLAAVEAKITDFLVEPQYEERNVQIKMPKFKIEAQIKYKPILQALGITDAFGPSADFSGIGETKQALLVDDILQKTFIDVQEDGTTAAAATIVTIRNSAAPIGYKTFHADHPFIFYLKSRAGILFVGRYVGKH